MKILSFKVLSIRCGPGYLNPSSQAPNAGSGMQPTTLSSNYAVWMNYVAEGIRDGATSFGPEYAGKAASALTGLSQLPQNSSQCAGTNLRDPESRQKALSTTPYDVGKKLLNDFSAYGKPTHTLAYQYLSSISQAP
jgi:hypothetical protein